jgi:DNA-binding NtrC family response regulator
LQGKLLHVLQDGTFTRLGGNAEIRTNARVLTATHRDLTEMVAGGDFREDLFFRLNVVTIRVPPLRERLDEIPALVERFLAEASARYRRPQRRLSARLMRLLERHEFAGNVRELENMMKRIVVLESEEPVIETLLGRGAASRGRSLATLEHLIEQAEASAGDVPLRNVARQVSLEAEREAIERALHQTSWNRKRAAELLGVSYKTLLQKIRECGLSEGK